MSALLSIAVLSAACQAPTDLVLEGDGIACSAGTEGCILEFGVLELGFEATKGIVVRNAGETTVEFASIEVVGDAAFSVSGDTSTPLAASDTRPLTVAARLTEPERALATFLILIKEGPWIRVDVTAIGQADALQDISPARCDFGIVAIGDSASCAVEVTNDGDEEMRIDSVSFSDPIFSVLDELPVFVPPGVAASLSFLAAPTEAVSVEGESALVINGSVVAGPLLAVTGEQ